MKAKIAEPEMKYEFDISNELFNKNSMRATPICYNFQLGMNITSVNCREI